MGEKMAKILIILITLANFTPAMASFDDRYFACEELMMRYEKASIRIDGLLKNDKPNQRKINELQKYLIRLDRSNEKYCTASN
jgi:hypothetical protein